MKITALFLFHKVLCDKKADLHMLQYIEWEGSELAF